MNDPLRCHQCGRLACAHTDPTPVYPSGSHYLEDARAVAEAIRRMVERELAPFRPTLHNVVDIPD